MRTSAQLTACLHARHTSQCSSSSSTGVPVLARLLPISRRRCAMRSSGRRFLTVAGLVGLVGGAALGSAPTAGAVATELFSSGEPGFHAGAAEVPPDICFVTIAADGGSGG